MTYQILVVLERDIADDCGVVRRNAKHRVTVAELVKQACAELQMAYDNSEAVAGSFTVVAVILDGETHSPNSLTPVEKLS